MQLTTGFLPGEPVILGPTGSGMLDGKTFAVKDIFDIAGHVTGMGNPDWAETHGPCDRHAEAVALLLAAGGRMVGKTVTDELAYSLAGENAHYGTPPNPALPGSVTGGSSCGSASVVAAGLADVALGTDTGGSIRIPASYCGLFGFRPTHDRISCRGLGALAPSFDTVGWFARSALELQQVGEVLLPEMSSSTELSEACLLSDVAALATQSLMSQTEQWQHRLPLQAGPAVSVGDLEQFLEAFRVVQGVEAWSSFGRWVRTSQPRLGPGIRERLEAARQFTADQALSARTTCRQLRARVHQIIGGHRVLCLPTAGGAATPIGAPLAEIEKVRHRTLQMTAVAGLAGCPQITLPLLQDERGPVGWSLIGPPDSDRELLALAVDMMAAVKEDQQP